MVVSLRPAHAFHLRRPGPDTSPGPLLHDISLSSFLSLSVLEAITQMRKKNLSKFIIILLFMRINVTRPRASAYFQKNEE